MDIGMLTGIGGLIAAIAALGVALAPWRLARRDELEANFLIVRNHLKDARPRLTDAYLRRHQGFRADPDVPLLTKSGWIPHGPLPLDALRLTLREAAPEEDLEPARRRLLPYWPDGSEPRRLSAYSKAVGALCTPQVWFNGCSYRLLEVHPPEPGVPAGQAHEYRLAFSLARYFDGLDTGESLGYEAALDEVRKRHLIRGERYRRWLGDPFLLNKRAALPGVNVLTVRMGGDGPGFFLHERQAAKVASAMNTTHVVPAGEFQPHSDLLCDWISDLNIWRTVMREYAEEFLGAPEASGDTGVSINYEGDEPYRGLALAAQEGRLRVRFLGIGLDPLTWKPEICLTCAWESSTFDEILGSMLIENREGKTLVGQKKDRGGYGGIPFTEENVLGYARRSETLPAGRACLTLAWRWRHELGLA